MAKAKTGSVPNKTLYSRVSYLYQAAAYMATQHAESTVTATTVATEKEKKQKSMPAAEISSEPRSTSHQPASRRLVADLRAVSHKVLMRMSPAMKHSICKNCDTMLIDGTTCKNKIENRSRGGKKPWADVLMRKCNTCGLARRFPLTAERRKRRPQREQEKLDADGKPS